MPGTNGSFTSVTISSCGSNYDTYLRVISLNEDNNMVEVAGCDDCGDCGLQTVLEAALLPGNYILIVEGYSSSEGNFVLSMECSQTTQYDALQTVQCGDQITGTTEGGTHVVPGGQSPERLYAFEVDETQRLVQFNACASSFDTWLRVVSPSLGEEFDGCDDCGPCGVQTVLDLDLQPGEYVLVVEGYGNDLGHFDITMTCSTESQGFVDGELECGAPVSGSTVAAGSHVGQGASDHIYSFTVNTPGVYEFDSCCSQFDTWLRVFRGTDTNLTNVLDLNDDNTNACTGPTDVGCELYSCDDCGPCGTRTMLQGHLEAGPYLLIVEGYASNEGEYVVQMRREGDDDATCGGVSAENEQCMCPPSGC
eukprot:COSAG05_NODE_197_length_14521_cov_113.902995_6_plen_365_part_00